MNCLQKCGAPVSEQVGHLWPPYGFLAGTTLCGHGGTGALGTFLTSVGPFALALPGEDFGGEVGRAGGGFVVGGGPLGRIVAGGGFTPGAFASEGGTGAVTSEEASVISMS